jgi:hypothetical protein
LACRKKLKSSLPIVGSKGTHVRGADHLRSTPLDELGLGGVVHRGRVVAAELELARRAEGAQVCFGHLLHAALDQVSTSSLKVRTVPFDLAAVGHHVGGFAGVDHGHRDHARSMGRGCA